MRIFVESSHEYRSLVKTNNSSLIKFAVIVQEKKVESCYVIIVQFQYWALTQFVFELLEHRLNCVIASDINTTGGSTLYYISCVT